MFVLSKLVLQEIYESWFHALDDSHGDEIFFFFRILHSLWSNLNFLLKNETLNRYYHIILNCYIMLNVNTFFFFKDETLNYYELMLYISIYPLINRMPTLVDPIVMPNVLFYGSQFPMSPL